MQEKTQNTNNTFFTKKKIIIFSVSLIVFIIFIVLTSKFLFDINFNTIGLLLDSSFRTNKLFFLWFFLLLLFPIYNCFLRVVIYFYKLHKKKILVEWYNWAIFCFVTFFISAITPFSMGCEPYIIYWLKKRGLSLKESTAIVASFTILNPFMQVLITWPSFFVICADYGKYSSQLEWLISFWSVFVGLIIDLIGTCFWFMMSASKNAHYFFHLLINKVKKIFKLKYKTKEEIKHEYKDNASFKKVFLEQMKDYKFVIFVSVCSLLWNVLYYCSLIFSFNLVDASLSFNPGDLFNYVNVATTANNFIPIPGAEGSLQAILLMFIKNSVNVPNLTHQELETITNNSVFIWRTMTFYLTAILGIVALVGLIFKELYKHVVVKIKIKKNIKDDTFTFVIRNKDITNLESTLLSINSMNYNFEKIEVIIYSDIKINKTVLEKYNNIKPITINGKAKNKIAILKYLDQKNLINNSYVNFIDSGDLISYEILLGINHVLRPYDVYACQYKFYSNSLLKKGRVKPYLNIIERRFMEKTKKTSPNLDFISLFIRKETLHKSLNSNIYNDDEINFYNALISSSRKIRYLKKIYGYKSVFNKNEISNDEKLEMIKKLIENKNKELAVYHLIDNSFYKYLVYKGIKLSVNGNFKFNWYPWYFKAFFTMYFKVIIYNKVFAH